jgi:hypothetical protein
VIYRIFKNGTISGTVVSYRLSHHLMYGGGTVTVNIANPAPNPKKN